MSQSAPLSGSNFPLKNRFSVPLSAKDTSSTDISAEQSRSTCGKFKLMKSNFHSCYAYEHNNKLSASPGINHDYTCLLNIVIVESVPDIC